MIPPAVKEKAKAVSFLFGPSYWMVIVGQTQQICERAEEGFGFEYVSVILLLWNLFQ